MPGPVNDIKKLILIVELTVNLVFIFTFHTTKQTFSDHSEFLVINLVHTEANVGLSFLVFCIFEWQLTNRGRTTRVIRTLVYSSTSDYLQSIQSIMKTNVRNNVIKVNKIYPMS